MNTRICLPLAMVLGIALGAPHAGAQTPFSGWFDGKETDTLDGTPPEKILVDGSVTGTASELGRFSLTYIVTVSLADGSATGTGVLTTASGDTVSTKLIGLGIPVNGSPSLNRIVEIHSITSGTGKFAGAKGGFIVERVIDLASGFTFGSVHGNLTLPAGGN